MGGVSASRDVRQRKQWGTALAKRKQNTGWTGQQVAAVPSTLPKNGVAKLNLGQSFAEYDLALDDPSTYVHTPAFAAAADFNSGKFFFVGRRGTGKTALRRYCAQGGQRTKVIVPEIFSPDSTILELDLLRNSTKRPFRSLVSAFHRSIQDELLSMWAADHPNHVGADALIRSELADFGGMDFDTRTLQFIARISRPLARGDEEAWLQENKVAKRLSDSMQELYSGRVDTNYTLIVDSIDDYWEGTEQSLVYLTAFMHACLETSAQIPWVRCLLFVRENIFERVRAGDSESSRLETSVVGMEWTNAQLLELVERRLNRPFNTKFALGGSTWNAWFERPDEARSEIFLYCQRRPRDVLIYTSHAIEAAQAGKHNQISIEDLQGARRRFSDNRLKDLGDEYAENYPQIGLVLSRFYGLGSRFTVAGLESLLERIRSDSGIARACGQWLLEYGDSIESFVRLLYNIGFVGIGRAGEVPRFRALGPQDTSPPPVSDSSDVVVHRCYWDALDLQDLLVRTLPEDHELGRKGVISDLPGGVDPIEYLERLDELANELRDLPHGREHAEAFEEIVGNVVRLCFFRALENVEHRVRDVDGRVIKDWVASNRAQAGFWELIRVRYQAVQVIWECKNYADLKADDFHQASYYLSEAGGRFVIVAYRGRQLTTAQYQHIKRIAAERRGLVLPLSERDLMTFIRQAKNGKIKEDHIQDRYDAVVRRVG